MSHECKYCGEAVSETTYLRHLKRDHEADLSGLDRRLVENQFGKPTRRNRTLYAGSGLVVLLLVLGYASMFVLATPSSADGQPYGIDTTDTTGTLAVSLNGEPIEFDDEQYLLQDDCFLFQAYDNAEVWHGYCQGVTINYAMGTLGFDMTDGTITIGDRTFDDDPNVEVTVTANAKTVDPNSYVLKDGDDIRIIIETK